MLLHSKAVCGRVVILLLLIPSPLLEILGNSHTTIPRLAFLNVPLVLRSFFLIKCFSKFLLSSTSGAAFEVYTQLKVYLTVFNGCPV